MTCGFVITDILKTKVFLIGVCSAIHQGLVGFAKADSKCTVLLSGERCLGIGN